MQLTTAWAGRHMKLGFGGLAMVVAGFIFDLLFAGLPYQDPTAEMQARWEFNKSIADAIILTGLALCLAGLARVVWSRLRKAGRSRTSP